MTFLPVLPIVVPLAGALLLAFLGARGAATQRALALSATLASLACSLWLLAGATRGEIAMHLVGGWPAPFGIALLVDRLSALMLVVTDVLALAAVAHASLGRDAARPRFFALVQFLLVGLHGAFVTGDLFNLFVFFEVLLIASYCLLVHGASPARLRAGLHYVVLNLAGSALFLVALGAIYGLLGTLHMAHVAVRVGEAPPGDAALVRSAALLLFVVFALKAALVPLHAWLPGAYPAAPASAAALFAVMTKVGVYGILRASTLVFAEGGMAGFTSPWLLPAALATQAVGVTGALGCRELGRMQSYLLVGSVGVMLTGVGLATAGALAGALFYLVQSTLTIGAMFLLADLVARGRGEAKGRLVRGPAIVGGGILGACFFAAALSAVGLPPSPGFLGKAWMLSAAIPAGSAGAVALAVTLASSLVALVACARAGIVLFWNVDPVAPPRPALPRRLAAPALGLLVCLGLQTALAGPVGAYLQATAEELLSPRAYVERALPRGER